MATAATLGDAAEAAGEAAALEDERKAARAAKARHTYEKQQRQKRVEQHERELPERQALVDEMREACEQLLMEHYDVRASAHADHSRS